MSSFSYVLFSFVLLFKSETELLVIKNQNVKSNLVNNPGLFAPSRINRLPYTTAIINGVTVGTRPFFVRVSLHYSKRFCGGTVIDDHWVITAATCVNHHRGQYQNPD